MCNDPIGQPDTAVQNYASNLYCDASGVNCALPTAAFLTSDSACNTTNNYSFAQWQGIGQDLGSLNTDPLFNNPYYPADDFSLQSGSPASSVGFVPFELNAPGRKTGSPAVPAVAPTFVIATWEASSQTSMVSSGNPVNFGSPVSFTTTILSALGFPADGENVTFTDNGITLGAAAMKKGVAVFTTSSLAVGTHPIQATYSGDPVFGGSTSIIINQNVIAAATTTVVTSSLNPSNYGQAVTFTATVTSIAGIPSGTVTFQQNGVVMGSSNLNSIGVATYTISNLGPGSRNVIAKYNGSTDFGNSSSATLVQVINKASTATSLSASPNPANKNQNVTLTATVTSAGGVPTGKVQFNDNGTDLGSSSLNSSGVATFSHAFKTSGAHSVSVNYKGDGNFNTSSGTITETIN